ncbi:T9SS type A sorting domain-containing protein, partial [bacterium]|nr:T9SS type A sorting domain-containing protein [bacterium]
ELSNYRIIKDDQVEYLKDLKVINENRYVIVTDTDTLNKRIAGVSVLDSIGNVLHRKIFAVTDYSIFFSILPFNNGDVGFTGTVETHLDRRRDVIVVRSDSNLYVKPVGILPNSNIVIQNFKLYQNYPNPFNPTTKITIEFPTRSNINQNLNIEIKIFDISGKELKSFENNYFNNSSTVIIFDGNNLPSGLYFYSLFIKNKIYDTKKMILIH